MQVNFSSCSKNRENDFVLIIHKEKEVNMLSFHKLPFLSSIKEKRLPNLLLECKDANVQ